VFNSSIHLAGWNWALWLAVFLALSTVAVYWDHVRSLGLWAGLRSGWRLHPSRMAAAVCMAGALMVGATKGPTAAGHAVQFVTALSSGLIIDPSGVVGRASEQAVLESFAEETSQIVAAATQTVAQAEEDFAALAGLVTNVNRKLWYLASDLPRADPQILTNHNIAATIERVRQNADGSIISQWVWFSEDPATNPTVAAEIDLGAGWVRLEPVTNTWPLTEAVNGAECVRYDYAVPETARGVVFRPYYELGFGSDSAPLIVPSAGVSVSTNSVECWPFSGTDALHSNLTVTSSGGIAISAVVNGAAATNNGIYEVFQ
jgi:hypothetical protein